MRQRGCGLVSGHDFSRAENAEKSRRASQAAEKPHKGRVLYQGTTSVVPKMPKNHGGLQPLRAFLHISAAAFAVTMVCLNKIEIHLD